MGNCAGRGFDKQNSSAFDRVTSRTSTDDDCLLYQLADYQKGGDLVKFFTKEGPRATEDLLKEQIPLLLYRKGEGQVVTRTDYLKWKYRGKRTVAVPVDEHIPGWKDHRACWNFEYRGSLGESLLHVLIVCNTSKHFKLAKMLIVAFPNLALDVVEGNEFRGASALHLAIAYNNLELIKLLVEAGAGIDSRAVGTFFLPKDQQRARPARTTDYDGLAYFGEYPLAWSACCNNEAAYNLLIDRGADPNAQDSFGNMVLHMVVVCDKLEMYGYALRHPRIQAKMGIVNKAGLTPLTLSCHLGRATIFREMLELTAKEFWRYSNITCSAYPLNALDTILPDGRCNMTSALMIILNGTKEEHLDMLDGGIIQRLLEEKWKTFARIQFLKRLGILFFHLIALSGAVYLRPSQDRPLMGAADKLDAMDYTRFCFEITTCLSCIGYVIVQQSSELKNLGLKGYLSQLSHNPAKAIFLASNILTLSCIPCRLLGKRELEEAILIFALPSAWFFLMFFAGAIRLTGPFVTMIYSMITGDMLTFAIIYAIMLLAFSQAFFFLHRGHPDKPPLFSNFFSTWMGLFQWTLGDYNYPSLGDTVYPALTKIVFVIFMIMVPILLLNMLIAMMGNTYALVIQQSEKEWVKQWAKIVIALERAVSQHHAKEYLVTYSIKVSGGSDGSDGSPPQEEVRGVMVIKSKNKTRARQRKGALGNWKRVGRVTINYLKRRGITGETLRRQIWDPRTPSTTSMNGSPCLTPIPCPTSAAMLLMDMNGGAGMMGGGGMIGGGLGGPINIMANDSLLENSFAFGAAFNDMSGFNGPNNKSSNVPANLGDPLNQDLFNTALINKLSGTGFIEDVIEPSYTAPVASAPPLAPVNPVLPPIHPVAPVSHVAPLNPVVHVNPMTPATGNLTVPSNPTVPVNTVAPMSPAVPLHPMVPDTPLLPGNPIVPMNPMAPGNPPVVTGYSMAPVSQVASMAPAVHINPMVPEMVPACVQNPAPPGVTVLPGMTPVNPPVVSVNPMVPVNIVMPGVPEIPEIPEIPKEIYPPIMSVNPIIPVVPTNPVSPMIPTNPNYPAPNPSYPANNPNYPSNNPIVPVSPNNPNYPAANPSYPANNPIIPVAPNNPIYPTEQVLSTNQMNLANSDIQVAPTHPVYAADLVHQMHLTNPNIPVNPIYPTTNPVIPVAPVNPIYHIDPITAPVNQPIPTNPVAPVAPVCSYYSTDDTDPTIPISQHNPITPMAPVYPTEPITPVIQPYPIDPIIPMAPIYPTEPIVSISQPYPTNPIIPVTSISPTYSIDTIAPVNETISTDNQVDVNNPLISTDSVDDLIQLTHSMDATHEMYPTEHVMPSSQMNPTIIPVAPANPANAICPFDPIHSINPMNLINQPNPTLPITPPTPVSPTAPVSMFPPLPQPLFPPLPIDTGPPIIDLLDNSSQLSDIENEIIAQTLLSNVQQPIRVARKETVVESEPPKDTLPPLFRARLLDTPAQSIEGEPIAAGDVPFHTIPSSADDRSAALIPEHVHCRSSTPNGSRRQSTPDAFHRPERSDLMEMRRQGKSLSVVDNQYQQNDRLPPLASDDKLLDPSGKKRGSKTRSRKHQFNRMNVVAPSDPIYHLDDHMQQLDVVNDLDSTRDSDIFQRLNERTFATNRSLARSTTVADDPNDGKKKRKQKQKTSSPGRLRRHSDNDSFASSVDESLYSATRVMPRKQRVVSRSSSSSSGGLRESKMMAHAASDAISPREQQQPPPVADAPVTPLGVFHISGTVDDAPETARTENGDGEKNAPARARSPKMSAKPAANKRSVGRNSKVSTINSKIKKITMVGPVLIGKKTSRPSRDSIDRTTERASPRTSLTSTSTRIDQAKADHFHSQGSPAVLNLNQLMGGMDSQVVDDMDA